MKLEFVVFDCKIDFYKTNLFFNSLLHECIQTQITIH